ncbi:MAG: hypothetical protein FDZ69_01935 [Deltaproteobacteria bacterium]|nr:MAG: hypothetical protein FDZ69_01935 [Deltaproteobacteria bacterium]
MPLAFALLLVLAACTFYESREVAFRPPDQIANVQQVGGARVAAEQYADKAAAKAQFGFDIRGAGLMPVQVVIDNQGPQRFEVVPDQTFLVDASGAYWPLLDRRTAYQRVEGSSEYGTILKGAASSGMWAAAAGALAGAAIGILSGSNVGEAAGKGAAVGAAAGAIYGGTKGATSEEAGRQISHDLANKSLESRVVEPGNLARGFLFFPGEAPNARQLRLQLRDAASGQSYSTVLIF